MKHFILKIILNNRNGVLNSMRQKIHLRTLTQFINEQNDEADISCGPQMLSTDLLLSTNTIEPKQHSKI